jgi:hypothetical protein
MAQLLHGRDLAQVQGSALGFGVEKGGAMKAKLFWLVGFMLWGTLLGAQQYQRIERFGEASLNEPVEMEGTVAQWVSGLGGNFYLLRTNWGENVLVRTSRPLPAIDKRYRVRGVVTEQLGKRFISEEELELIVTETTRETQSAASAVTVSVQKESAGGAPLPSAASEPPAAPVPGGQVMAVPAPAEPKATGTWDSRLVLPIAAGTVGLLALLVGGGLLLRRSRPREEPNPYAIASGPLAQAPLAGTTPNPPLAPEPQAVTGKTIKIHQPPAGTIKVLPGRFEVAAGDETVKEIRFYRVPTQAIPEVTFGRLPGAPYVHVQLSSPTVSSRQAKVTYQDNRWVLTNFAPESSNPTRVNGRELRVDETVALNEGDRVEMGEVVLIFHTK